MALLGKQYRVYILPEYDVGEDYADSTKYYLLGETTSSININQATIDVSSKDSVGNFSEFIGGQKSADISVNVFAMPAKVGPLSNEAGLQQKTLDERLWTGQYIWVAISDDPDNYLYFGKALITSEKLSSEQNGVVTKEVSLQISDALGNFIPQT